MSYAYMMVYLTHGFRIVGFRDIRKTTGKIILNSAEVGTYDDDCLNLPNAVATLVP